MVRFEKATLPHLMSRKPFEITLDLPNSKGREKHRNRKKMKIPSLLSRPDLLSLMYYNTTATRFECASARRGSYKPWKALQKPHHWQKLRESLFLLSNCSSLRWFFAKS
jgi:hypothetical protein